jgi:hypothetical protein
MGIGFVFHQNVDIAAFFTLSTGNRSDAEKLKYIMTELDAACGECWAACARVQRLREEFAYEMGKMPLDTKDEEGLAITWPAHMKPPKKNGNGNGNGRHHREHKNRNAESN